MKRLPKTLTALLALAVLIACGAWLITRRTGAPVESFQATAVGRGIWWLELLPPFTEPKGIFEKFGDSCYISEVRVADGDGFVVGGTSECTPTTP